MQIQSNLKRRLNARDARAHLPLIVMLTIVVAVSGILLFANIPLDSSDRVKTRSEPEIIQDVPKDAPSRVC